MGELKVDIEKFKIIADFLIWSFVCRVCASRFYKTDKYYHYFVKHLTLRTESV